MRKSMLDDSECTACEGTGETFGSVYDGSPWRECEACNGYGLSCFAPREAYQALVAESARVGWPKHYREDLTAIDRAMLDEYPADRPFVWILREMGTHLYMASPLRAWGTLKGREWYIWEGPEVLHADDPTVRAYFWDGRKLRHVETLSRAAELLRDASRRIPICPRCKGAKQINVYLGGYRSEMRSCDACKGVGEGAGEIRDYEREAA